MLHNQQLLKSAGRKTCDGGEGGVMIQINLEIPWRVLPKNRQYRRGRGGKIYLDPKFKEFQDNCLTWLLQWGNLWVPGEVWVELDLWFKDRRYGDADNYQKTIGDILQKSGIVENDKLIFWGPVNRYVGLPERAEIRIMQKVHG